MSISLDLAAFAVQAGGTPAVQRTIDPAVFEELRELADTLADGFLADLLEQFMQETQPLLAELRHAVHDGDASAVRRVAHSIKGSSGQLGGLRLASSCARLEALAAAVDLPVPAVQVELQEAEAEYRAMCSVLTPKMLSPVRRPR
jgi:HPt (histidine-containing phosphotransfer) domain-containing protein